MYLTQLVHFCRIDIHMDNAGVWCEGVQFASHPVIKTCTHGDKQIALLHCEVRRFGAVHSQHAQIVRIIRFNCAQPFQRAGDRHFCSSEKFTQSGNCLRHAHATANVQHRFLRLCQHLARLLDFGMWEIHFVFNGGEPWFQIAAG